MWRNWKRYTVLVGVKKGEATMKNSLAVSQFNIKLLCNFTPRYTSEKIENRYSNKNLYTNVHSITVYNR